MFKPGFLLCLMAAMFGSLPAWAIDDPTRPPATKRQVAKASTALPKLNSILIGVDRRLAVIEGQILQEGDRGAGFELVVIEANAVTLLIDGAERRLTMGGQNIHKELK